MSEVVVEQVDRAVILLPQSMTDHQRESLASHDSRLNNLKLCLNTLNKLNLDQLLMDLANDVMQLFKVRMY
jgi:nicotinic acid mononucleotide adenylyltransferase